jgi:hypothetical protein
VFILEKIITSESYLEGGCKALHIWIVGDSVEIDIDGNVDKPVDWFAPLQLLLLNS